MGGQAAALGFEYQFLCTLSFALRRLLDADDWLTGVVVDAPPSDDLSADQEIVDFALLRDDGCGLAAQVKGGGPGSTMSAADAVRILLRLLTHDADRYALITNRRSGPGLGSLIESLHGDDPREGIAAQLSRSPELRRAVLAADGEWVDRLARVQIVLDDRSVDELRVAAREQVRAARRRVDPGNVGWDAAGLLTGYLTAEVLAKAASPASPMIDRAALETALRIEPGVLRSLMRERDWAVPLTPVPRATDVARPDVLERIARTLSTPVRGDSVPVCVLTGLSGIGKTGVATAWIEDRADAYATVLWVEAATTAQIEASFVQAAARLAGHEAGSGRAARDVVRTSLAGSARPWLVVFDNATSLRSVRDWLPTSGLGHLLVITVDPTAVTGPNTASVRVGAMTEEQAVTLLAARLLPDRVATAAETNVMRGLAARMQYWPLALELAATYLNDCLGGLAGVAAYEDLVMRSLDDEDAVPLGYPHTVVRVIQLAWQRMLDRPAPADHLAVEALRCASLLAPRRIPLHLLLSACGLEPRSLLEDGVERGPRVYDGIEPPLGEVVRAMRRQSLVVADTPLWGREDDVAQHSTAFTVAVNEIVQTVLLDELRRSGQFDVVLSLVAFHTQYWLSYYIDHENYAVARVLAAHGVSAVEHALANQSRDYCVALLLGNTACMLDIADLHDLAADYLRAELEILRHNPNDQSLLRLQTATHLASVLYEGADRPRDVADDMADALEEMIKYISPAYEADQEVTARTVRKALSAIFNLVEDGGGATPRIDRLRAALEQYRAMMPITGGPDLPQEIAEINALIKESEYDEAVLRVNRLIGTPGLHGPERTQFFRLRLECRVWQRDWDATLRELQPFVDAATAGTIRANDAAHVSRNVAFAALQALTRRDGPAATVLKQAVSVADLFEGHGRSLQAQDKVVMDLFRCICLVLAGEVDQMRRTLDRLDAAELARQRSVVFDLVHGLLQRWSDQAPRWAPHTKESVPNAILHPTPAFSDEEMFGTVLATPLAFRPLMAAAFAQAYGGIGAVDDGYLTTAVDLVHVLELMGFQAEVVSTECTLRTMRDTARVVFAQHPHHVVYSAYFGRVVDPGLTSLIASIEALPDPPHTIPSMMPVTGLDQLRHGSGLLTGADVVAVYQRTGAPLGESSTDGDLATPFIIAIKALMALMVAGDIDALVRVHPTMNGVVLAVR